ncbi:MAG: fibronectin type III domain-containing protein [Anaerolineaceae bacterium]
MTIADKLLELDGIIKGALEDIDSVGGDVPEGAGARQLRSSIATIPQDGAIAVTFEVGDAEVGVIAPIGDTRRIFWQESEDDPDEDSWFSVEDEIPFTITDLVNGTEYRFHDGVGSQLIEPVADATVPNAFTTEDWVLEDTETGGSLSVLINQLPADGGSEITDIEYRLDSGSPVSSGGVSGFAITGLTDEDEYDVQIRAVNSIGEGDWSDTKSETPTEVIPEGWVLQSNNPGEITIISSPEPEIPELPDAIGDEGQIIIGGTPP